LAKCGLNFLILGFLDLSRQSLLTKPDGIFFLGLDFSFGYLFLLSFIVSFSDVKERKS